MLNLQSWFSSRPNSPLPGLVGAAGASGLIYLFVFTLPFPLPRLYNTIPPVDYTKLTNYSAPGLLLYVAGVGLLFGLYGWALRLCWPSDAPVRSLPAPAEKLFLGASSLGFGLILLFSYPLTAIDLFIYAIRTRGWALYGLQPLATPPQALPAADPWLGLAGEWIDAASPYGPVWEWLSLGAFYLSGGGFLAHLLALKLIALAAYLGCLILIYHTLSHRRPRWRLAGTLAFAWNPLVLFESVQNGHNDIVMTFFLLAAIWVWLRGGSSLGDDQARPVAAGLWPPLLACLLLALSILVKFATLLIAPFFWLALAAPAPTWPRRLLRALSYGLLTGAMVVGLLAPLWPGWAQWAVPQAGSQAGRSLLALLVLAWRDSLGVNAAFELARSLILAGFGLLYLFHLWRSWRASPPTGEALFIAPAFFVLGGYVLLAAPVFHAWYLLWFAPLASLLLPRRRPLRVAVLFSLSALLIIAYFETVRVWYPVLLQNQLLGHLIGVPLFILPPLLSLLWPISPSAPSEV